MVAMLDTNIVVDFLRNRGDSATKIAQITEPHLNVTVCGELIFGASISGNPTKNMKQVTEFIARSKIDIQNISVAESYAEIRKHLKEKGRPIPENDIWIAATALAYGLKLITRDQHFANIDFLNVEFWK
jgi:tRNA(fMet)-specific endonuclease VapC